VPALAAGGGLLRAIDRGADSASRVSGIALVYLGGAGAATLVVSSGRQPLGYDLFVILLTAVHYHYAGLALVLSTALAARRLGDGTARAGAWLVAGGVPLVASGIALTKAGGGDVFEGVAAVIMAASGLLAAAIHGRLALAGDVPAPARVAFGLAAFGLAIGMPLAALYGLRVFGSTAFLDLTAMGAVHGTANALGVGVAALVGWARVTRR
jgi:hypothetical protein